MCTVCVSPVRCRGCGCGIPVRQRACARSPSACLGDVLSPVSTSPSGSSSIGVVAVEAADEAVEELLQRGGHIDDAAVEQPLHLKAVHEREGRDRGSHRVGTRKQPAVSARRANIADPFSRVNS